MRKLLACGEGLVRFIVPNEIAATPVSLISGIGVIKELGATVNNLVEKELELGESEVKFSYYSTILKLFTLRIASYINLVKLTISFYIRCDAGFESVERSYDLPIH
ncbi:uncharacterized protein A4U43_C04F17910 [Asparagus officinalis]|uniref:Uncharacterized protein n=1 Tax=Asparagus officinalis TaxID=4686 RepID=A0A5P1F6K4_ASPOF|nr:uncharacterized protein A4U43_C04F17910 [Asparagus officinalis]